MLTDACLSGRTAIVTGGGTGLGRAMAEKFADLGANVVVASRDPAHLEPAVAALRARGKGALAVRCDVRNFEQVEALIGEAERAFGGVDVLVNNAAGNFLCPTEDLTPGGFAAVVGIVLTGTFHATLAAGRRMIARGGGSILNILTTYAWTGSGFVVPSAAAKAGVLAMTRSLAVEWAKYKIRVNGIAPGPFPTEGAWNALMPSAEFAEHGKARVPLKRYGEPEELANLAAYLVSDYASYITGEIVTIDGGRWLAGAGEFNEFAMMDPDAIKPIVAAMRPKPKKAGA